MRTDFDPLTSFDRRSRTVRFTITIDTRRKLDVHFEGVDFDVISDEDLRAQLTFNEAASSDDVEANESAKALTAHLQTLGRIFHRESQAEIVATAIRQQIAAIQSKVRALPPRRVLYVLNSHPLITVGPGSFIHELIGLAGGLNAAAEASVPYPRLNMEVVLKADPEVLLFPVGKAEGVPLSEQQVWQRWPGLSAVQQNRLRSIPSDLLNRPGPRIAEGLEALARAIHPEAFVVESQP